MKNCLLDNILLSSLMYVSTSQNIKLTKIGLNTVKDLLLYLPSHYENRTSLCNISNLLPGSFATVEGKILSCNITSSKKKMMICQIRDKSGILTLRFFNFNSYMKSILSEGKRVLVYGKVKYSKNNMEMIHPEYHVQSNFYSPVLKTLTPIYPNIRGIKKVIFNKLIDRALNLLSTNPISELLPPELAQSMMSLSTAIRVLHRPPINSKLKELENGQHPAQVRLIFEELLAHNLNMLALRNNIQQSIRSQSIPVCNILKNKFLTTLPFRLTKSQIRVIGEIENDMLLNIPMMRLIQGDVGSGKTLVAALAALNVIACGKQVALMAPTELLAKQHTSNFRQWFARLGFKISCIIGKEKEKVRLVQQTNIFNGEIQIIIGTHAIFQKQIKFRNLALIIIDEQHRFGVRQRLALWEKGLQQLYHPHQLIMTATPIPRTLAMSIYANLNVSTIDTLPPGRIPIITVVISDTKRNDIINRIRNICIKEKRQAYWVCSVVEKSKLLWVRAAKITYKELQLMLPELNIGLIHGHMKLIEKQMVMKNFRQGKLHLLVTTTVIEVGVDIPNASLMIIENSERMGLSQLHQLRGRIGRSTIESYCVLLYKSPLSKIAKERLQIIRDNIDGFKISQRDLEIRGCGELFGTRQTGNVEYKIVNLLRDYVLLPKIQHVALYMYRKYPEKSIALIKRWMYKIENYSKA